MNSYLEHVGKVIRATAFHSPMTYSWFGKLSPELPAKTKRAMTLESARTFLLYNLQARFSSEVARRTKGTAPSAVRFQYNLISVCESF